MSTNEYLTFISDSDLLLHVKNTILKYRLSISFEEFKKNLIDPIKLTFDSKVYHKTYSEVIESECLRQIEKTNEGSIGYFHQNLFKYMGNGWVVPPEGYDIVNNEKNIFVELKNKHNTMNSSASQKTYMRMQNTILRNDKATCMLVEVIAKNSQNITWVTTVDKERFSNDKIRRVSIDQFYEIATGEKYAFRNLCQILPTVIDIVVNELADTELENNVFEELQKIDKDILKSIYLQSFDKYFGFNTFSLTK